MCSKGNFKIKVPLKPLFWRGLDNCDNQHTYKECMIIIICKKKNTANVTIKCQIKFKYN